MSTTLAVLVHEIPHEIGDFAILIKSGWSVGHALCAQLLTAIGALVGVVIGAWPAVMEAMGIEHDKHEVHQYANHLLPFTAGGFVYVAMVNVLPTLLEEKVSLWQTIKEVTAMLLGVALMYLIGLYE